MTQFRCLVLLKEPAQRSLTTCAGSYAPANKALSGVLFYEFVPETERNGLHIADRVRNILKRLKITHDFRTYLVYEDTIALEVDRLAPYVFPLKCRLTHLKSALDKIFTNNDTDWLRILSNKLEGYYYSNLYAPNPLAWLNQFEQLGSFRWIGERLLQSLDFWDGDRLDDAFNVEEITKRVKKDPAFAVCVDDSELGSSGSAIAGFIKKRIESDLKFPGQLKVEGIFNIFKDGYKGSILYLEDSLCTGHQQIRIFKALSEANVQKSLHIEIRFAVAANYGHGKLKRFLREQGWTDVAIYPNNPDDLRQFLSEEGMNALDSGNLYTTNDHDETIIKDLQRFDRRKKKRIHAIGQNADSRFPVEFAHGCW